MRRPEGLSPVAFEALDGFTRDSLDEALAAFRRSAVRIVTAETEQRPARQPPPGLVAASQAALEEANPEDFFRRWFRPFRLNRAGFVTAYYEPEVEARLAPEPGFETPILSRPPDLVTLNEAPLRLPTGETLTSARRAADGTLAPYPDRRAIEEEGAATGSRPIAFVRDAVELFLMQVQGSARLRLPDGASLPLTYDGRNGWPYTSIGRLLIERGITPAGEMSLETMKATLRRLGAASGEPGRKLMQENRSSVFFGIDASSDRQVGPIGGEGCALTPLRSIAVNRSIWCYGLPFWIETRVPWQDETEAKLERLMIAQDTGSAILGAARADLFFGAGDAAGRRAGLVRHPAEFTVFLPVDEAAP